MRTCNYPLCTIVFVLITDNEPIAPTRTWYIHGSSLNGNVKVRLVMD